MKFDFLGLRQSVNALANNLRDVRRKIESLRRAREEIAVAPVTRDDAIAILHKRIDVAADTYLKRFTENTLLPVVMKAYGGTADGYNHSILATPAVGQAATPATLEAGICYALKEPIKKAVAEAVRHAEWPAGAVALAERDARLQKLDDEIGELEKEELELSKCAAEAGVIVS